MTHPRDMTTEERQEEITRQEAALKELESELSSLQDYRSYWGQNFFYKVTGVVTFRWVGYQRRSRRLSKRLSQLMEDQRTFITWASEYVENIGYRDGLTAEDVAPFLAHLTQLDQLLAEINVL